MFSEETGVEKLVEWMNRQPFSSSTIDDDTLASVRHIQARVQASGDDALCELTATYDHVTLTPQQLRVPESAIKKAYDSVEPSLIDALTTAAQNIRSFHERLIPTSWEDAQPDHTLGVQYTPIDSVGLYVPGGRAAYPSSVLMTAVPAALAGCRQIVMVSPPTGGTIPPQVLVAADIAGVTEIYQVGGAQSIFALANGTQHLPKVDKIVGPGNRFVTAAKQLVYGTVDIDKPAGPSEVCVYIDNIDYANFAAAEMWAQLEHDPDASAICLTSSHAITKAVQLAATQQLLALSRQHILRESKHNGVVVTLAPNDSVPSAIDFCASEHLVLLSDNAQSLRGRIRHAGSIFCGPYSPVTLGDYYAGPNHVLPTGKSARFASPLGVMDFMKYSSYLEYSKEKLQASDSHLAILTKAEGFDAHYQAIHVRLNAQ